MCTLKNRNVAQYFLFIHTICTMVMQVGSVKCLAKEHLYLRQFEFGPILLLSYRLIESK